jgi:hypothetical protein
MRASVGIAWNRLVSVCYVAGQEYTYTRHSALPRIVSLSSPSSESSRHFAVSSCHGVQYSLFKKRQESNIFRPRIRPSTKHRLWWSTWYHGYGHAMLVDHIIRCYYIVRVWVSIRYQAFWHVFTTPLISSSPWFSAARSLQPQPSFQLATHR